MSARVKGELPRYAQGSAKTKAHFISMLEIGQSAGDSWLVVLQGDKSDLARLSKACTSPELSVVQKENVFYLQSSNFAPDVDYNSISQNAGRFVSLLNAICKLRFKSRTPLGWHAYLSRLDGTRVLFAVAEVRVVSLVLGVGGDTSSKDSRLITLALGNHSVARALKLVSEPDWNSFRILSNILDVIEGDMRRRGQGRQAIVSRKWATQTEISRFRYSASSPAVAGKDARHGDETRTHPPQPMTQLEAQTFVESILDKWLESFT